MNTVKCSECGADNLEGGKNCHACGARVSDSETVEVDGLQHLEEDLQTALRSQYRIVRLLGRGGMGAVFLAEEAELDRPVAIKVLPPLLLTFREGLVERFKREARTAAALDHPNIIPVYSVGEASGLLYYVMKYVDGCALNKILRRHRTLPLSVVQAILVAVSDALAHAHASGVIHRDIKPANIMLDKHSRVWVADFGIAKAIDATSLTESGGIIGTPQYMSPEQSAGTPADARTDQYSLGIVAYEMLVGEVPFTGGFLPELIWKHMQAPVPPLVPQRPETPAALAQLVDRLLEKDPDRRFASMDECFAALQTLQTEHPHNVREAQNLLRILGEGRQLPAAAHPVEPLPSRPAGRRLWIPLAAAAMLGLAIGGYSAIDILRNRGGRSDQVSLSAGAESTPATSALSAEPAGAQREETPEPESETLKTPPTPPPPATLELHDLPPGAIVMVDGRAIKGNQTELEAGVYTVRVEAPGFTAREREVSLVAGERLAVSLPLVRSPPPEPRRATTGVLTVAGLPSGGWVSVDGQVRRGTSFRLPPGLRVIRMEAPGYDAVVDSVRVSAGQEVRLVFTGAAVRPEPPEATAPQPSILQIRITPWANVLIDGVDLGPNSRLVDTLAAGPHRLRFEREGYAPKDTTITLEPGERRRIAIRLNARNR